MALFSRIFQNRRSNKPATTKWYTSEQCNNVPRPEFSGSQVRLVLYRDQDLKGRSLHFDSKAVHRVEEHDAKGGQKKAAVGQPAEESLPRYTHSRPGPDAKMLEEMAFGAVGMAFRGSTLKVHTIRSPPQLMVTKVFVPSVSRARESGGSDPDSLDCSLNYSASDLSVPQKVTATPSALSSSIAQSVPVAVPGPQPRDHDPEDSGFSTSGASSSVSSLTASMPRSSSSSSLNSNSFTSMTRRWRRSQHTSLEHNLLKRPSDEGVYEQPLPVSKRPCKVGLVVVISLPEDDEQNTRTFQNFFFSHITLIDCHMERLRLGVERAMASRKAFHHLMVEALETLRRGLGDLYLAPRLAHPVWLDMMWYTTQRVSLCHRFLAQLMVAVTKYDTKQTKFLLSTLLTAVLTNHLAWVPTVTPAGATPSRSYLDKHSAKWLDAVAKSHPYNPLWAQLGDMYGALGFPLRLTRTVVVGKKTDLVNRFLYILSYFIRCSEVLERNLQPYDFDTVDVECDDWPEVSSDTVLVPASTPPTACSGKCSCSGRGLAAQPCAVCTPSQANRMSPGYNGASSGSRAAGGTELEPVSCRETPPGASNTSPPQTDVVHVKLKEGALSDVCGKSAAEDGLHWADCGLERTVSAPHSRDDQSPRSCHLKNATSIFGQSPVLLACISGIRDVELAEHPPAGSMLRLGAASACETAAGRTQALSGGPAAAEGGGTRGAVCRMSPTAISERPRTEQLRHVGKMAVPDPASMSPVLGLHPAGVDLTGVKREAVRPAEAELTRGPSVMTLAVSDSENICDNNSLAEAAVDATSANCDIENNPSTNRDANQRKLLKYEYSHDSGMYDPLSLHHPAPGDGLPVACVPGPGPPAGDTTPWVHKLYHVPMSFDHSSSMFDEYFTEEGDDTKDTAGLTDSLVCPTTSTPTRSKHLGSIDGSSLFDEYMNAPGADLAWVSETPPAGSDCLQDMFDEYYSSLESGGEASPCQYSDMPGLGVGPGGSAGDHCSGNRQETACLDSSAVRKEDGVTSRPRHFSNQSTVTLTPSRTRSVTPTGLARRRHGSSLSNASSIGPDFFSGLKEVDMPACDAVEAGDGGLRSSQRTFGRSLLAACSPHYLSDFVLHGTPDTAFQSALHHDLTMTLKNCVLDEQMSEAVCIVADLDNWSVKVQKCHYDTADRVRSHEVAASPLVCGVLESVHSLWKLNMSPEFCLMHLEDRLQEIYFKSRTVAEFLRLHKRVDVRQLASVLNLDVNDVPLLLAVAGTHTPLVAMALL